MLSNVLKHYKRLDVQKKIVLASENKEAVGSFGGKGYARRPDVLVYPADVFELVKNGVTSFHISEETWSDPLQIETGMPRKQLDDLRIGWDLVLDIDCPYWEFAKIVAHLFVQSLKANGVRSISVKFSGNKGFHIGVPFEAFPSMINGIETRTLFPEGPRKIAQYLLHYISDNLIRVEDDVVFFGDFSYPFEDIQSITGKDADELLHSFCSSCGAEFKASEKKVLFTCPVCGLNISPDQPLDYKKCPTCGVLMERSVLDRSEKCCANPHIVKTFDPLSIVEVDTVLIAPRHLYRAPYSYHEKSGLVSVPLPLDSIMSFDKSQAKIGNVRFDIPFLERQNADPEEGVHLLSASLEFSARQELKKSEKESVFQYSKDFKPKEFEDVTTAIPEKFFPPCIQAILKGLADGKKRALFVLINFLSSVGWNYGEMESFLRDWNKRNPEPLREVYLLGQLRHWKTHKKRVFPPNCDNKAYYHDFHVCNPDNLCRYVKNPALYAIKKARFAQKQEFRRSVRVKEGLDKTVEKDVVVAGNPEYAVDPGVSKTSNNPETSD